MPRKRIRKIYLYL